MAFHDIVMSRTATKHFDRRKVPADQVRALQDLIRHAASAFNLQPWRAVIVEDDACKRDLAEATWNQPQITTCSNLFVFCANTDLEALVARLEAESIRSGIPADTVRAFIGTVRDFTVQLQGTERLSWAQKQTYLALANGINGALSHGGLRPRWLLRDSQPAKHACSNCAHANRVSVHRLAGEASLRARRNVPRRHRASVDPDGAWTPLGQRVRLTTPSPKRQPLASKGSC